MLKTKNIIICIASTFLTAVMLMSCGLDDKSKAAIESNIANNTPDIITQENKSIESGFKPEQETKATGDKKTSKPLDLSWHNTLEAPQLQEKQLLPNMFDKKKADSKKASVSGKFYRKDEPEMELLDSLEGAEISVKLRIP